MLIKISCEKFREKDIHFHAGLNVVLGDDKATNSIGKTTLLKVVDFVFGGSSLLKYSEDVVQVLGHHSYNFTLRFERDYEFLRTTNNPDEVCLLGDGQKIVKIWSLETYGEFLKEKYTESIYGVSFRELVTLVSRIWPKPNLEPLRPLHAFSAQNFTSCVEYLIKLFGEFDKIDELTHEVTEKKNERSGIKKAFDNNIIQKINKTQHKENGLKIESKNAQIESIKEELSRFAISLNELINEAVLEAKADKNSLLSTKMELESQLLRVRGNLEASIKVTKKNFEPLERILPSINTAKLAEIEMFHSGLAKILKDEIHRKELSLLSQIEILDLEIAEADLKITQALSSVDKPSFIVDAVCDISLELSKLKRQNYYFESEAELTAKIVALNKEIVLKKNQILAVIESAINIKVRNIVDRVYDTHRKSPVISLSPSRYSYSIVQDTGTGSAYSNLIIFDIALLELTRLPFLIHDSVLYKNIQNDAVSNILGIYDGEEKQCFIAFDEMSKQSPDTQEILLRNKVLKLADDSVLYIVDWRKKPKEGESALSS